VDTAIFSRVLYQLSYLGGERILSAGRKCVKQGIRLVPENKKNPRVWFTGGAAFTQSGLMMRGSLGLLPVWREI
jgi:hypothetical protein